LIRPRDAFKNIGIDSELPENVDHFEGADVGNCPDVLIATYPGELRANVGAVAQGVDLICGDVELVDYKC
jgi:hypothetical protein